MAKDEFDAKLGVHTAIAFCREVEWVLKAMVSSHPNPKELLKYYEEYSESVDAANPFLALDDRALESSRRLRQELLATLRRIVSHQ